MHERKLLGASRAHGALGRPDGRWEAANDPHELGAGRPRPVERSQRCLGASCCTMLCPAACACSALTRARMLHLDACLAVTGNIHKVQVRMKE